MQILAIATDRALNIEAAMASPEIRQFKSLMARADIHPTKPMTLTDIDRRLTAAEIPLQARLALKNLDAPCWVDCGLKLPNSGVFLPLVDSGFAHGQLSNLPSRLALAGAFLFRRGSIPWPRRLVGVLLDILFPD